MSLTTDGVSGDDNFDWEYWDGTGWNALTVTNETDLEVDSFEDSGYFYFTAPGNWFPYSVNGSTDQYFIRGHLEGGSYTTDPIEDTVKTNILLLQYLSNISSEDQTFVVVPENALFLLLLMPLLPAFMKRKRMTENRRLILKTERG